MNANLSTPLYELAVRREDISHTRKIHAVVVGGKFFPLPSITAQALQDAANRQ
ncbi:MAG TPA: hypothetical protein VN950_07590 [Terriglobales bacterium]|nr:hypothetical protein [Terriglobales bacterium]